MNNYKNYKDCPRPKIPVIKMDAKAPTIQENIQADFDQLIKKYGVKDAREFARRFLARVAMAEAVQGKVNR